MPHRSGVALTLGGPKSVLLSMPHSERVLIPSRKNNKKEIVRSWLEGNFLYTKKVFISEKYVSDKTRIKIEEESARIMSEEWCENSPDYEEYEEEEDAPYQ